MEIFIFLASLAIAAIAAVRDNILASALLIAAGVLTAGAVVYAAPNAAAFFVLITLVYIVAALTLVIIAAASLSEGARTIELRKSAIAAAVFLIALLAAFRMPEVPNVLEHLDFSVIVPLAVLLLYAYRIAVEIST